MLTRLLQALANRHPLFVASIWFESVLSSTYVCPFDVQVTLNQLALAPVTLVAVFTWNLALTGQTAALQNKIKHDLVPSMINGELCIHCMATPQQHVWILFVHVEPDEMPSIFWFR